MLVLAAQVDRRPDALRQLAHARHRAVDGGAAADVGREAPAHDGPVEIVGAEIEQRLDLEGIGSLAHARRIGALAHGELHRGEERGLARSRLAREDREPARGLDRRIADERDVLCAERLEHHLPPVLP